MVVTSGTFEKKIDCTVDPESGWTCSATIRLRFQDSEGVWSDATLDNASGSVMRIMSVGL